jgi:hypothetical protein
MTSTARGDFWDKFHTERPGEVSTAATDPHDETLAVAPRPRRRPLRALFRFLVTVGIGVGGTLAWQAYGDMARGIAAAAYPEQLGWLRPLGVPVRSIAATAPATVGSAAPVPTADQQQLATISLNLASVRQSVEELAAKVASSQQQIAQVAASNQQMAETIARMQASGQEILTKLAAPPPRPRPAPTHKPAPLALTPAAPPAAAH